MGVGDEVRFLYYGDVLWVYCGVEWSEPGIWQFQECLREIHTWLCVCRVIQLGNEVQLVMEVTLGDSGLMTPWDSSEFYCPWALPWVSGLIFYNNNNNNTKITQNS